MHNELPWSPEKKDRKFESIDRLVYSYACASRSTGPKKENTMSNNKGAALITGASTGIGAVYADRLAKRGYDLILVARSKDKLDEVAKQIQSSTGRRVGTLYADFSVPADVKRIADRLASDHAITAFV